MGVRSGKFFNALVVGACLALGCQTPTQRVPLHLEPSGARVFVDGTEVPGAADALELRSDRPHVVLVRRDGYRPEQVVLETRRVDGVSRLEPDEIRLELEPIVPKGREIRIEVAD
jgi:hypothetical protein